MCSYPTAMSHGSRRSVIRQLPMYHLSPGNSSESYVYSHSQLVVLLPNAIRGLTISSYIQKHRLTAICALWDHILRMVKRKMPNHV